MLYNIKNLQKSRSRGTAYRLKIPALHIRTGERIAITGPSGCGKSTLLDMLGLALRPDSAEIFDFYPDAGATLPVRLMEIWHRGNQDCLAGLRLEYMGYVLQSGELLPFVTVGENMELTARLAGRSIQDARRDVARLAEKLGVGHLLGAYPAVLSFGERQRAAIVRALASRPHVILADEPTAALDPWHAEKVMTAFLAAVEEYGSTLILVTHNTDWVKKAGIREIRFIIESDGDDITAILEDGSKE